MDGDHGLVEPDVFNRVCPSRAVLSRIGEKWAALALISLNDGAMRFGAIKRKLDGISPKVLSQTLRNLECDGLVIRRVLSSKPIHVEYSLSSLSETLIPILVALKSWAESNLAVLAAVNRSYDATRSFDRSVKIAKAPDISFVKRSL